MLAPRIDYGTARKVTRYTAAASARQAGSARGRSQKRERRGSSRFANNAMLTLTTQSPPLTRCFGRRSGAITTIGAREVFLPRR